LDVDRIYLIVLYVVFLILSGIFSGSEVSLFSIDKRKLKETSKKANLELDYIFQLLETPKRLLVTILIGNTISNVAMAIIGVDLAIQYASYFHISQSIVIFVQIILTTIIILLFGEVTPKIIASKNPVKFAKFISIPIYWISVILYPIAKIITDFLKLISSKISFSSSKSAIVYNELHDLAEMSAEKGTIEENEHEIINGLVNFRTVLAREAMTPRVDIVAIPIEADYRQVLQIITDAGYSRYPLYKENLDDIIGTIYAKDLLPYIHDENLQKNLSLKNIARKALFIPETKKINELLHLFQESKLHIGIVVDEYGGTSGLISLEDVLEEIVGEIRDEYDQEENVYTKVDENKYLVLGKMKIDELNELISNDFSSANDEYDTVGGFIFSHTGSIPKDGYTFEKNGFKFFVKDVINKRINKVLIEKLQLNNSDDNNSR